jgi:hypothetical protein
MRDQVVEQAAQRLLGLGVPHQRAGQQLGRVRVGRPALGELLRRRHRPGNVSRVHLQVREEAVDLVLHLGVEGQPLVQPDGLLATGLVTLRPHGAHRRQVGEDAHGPRMIGL